MGIVLCYLLFDYARIYIVQTGERSTRVALSRSFGFVFGNLRRTLTLTFGGVADWHHFAAVLQPVFQLAKRSRHNYHYHFISGATAIYAHPNGAKTDPFAGEVSLFNALFFSK
ncbi:MAG: hypothetical protein R3C26_09925 [Calditrichia bacterium]